MSHQNPPILQPLTLEQAEKNSAELLTVVKEKMGRIPNILGTMAHSSATLSYYLNGSETLASSSLSATLRETIALALAEANNCTYCASAHTAIAVGNKLLTSQQTIAARAQKSDDPLTQAAIHIAIAANANKGHVTKELWNAFFAANGTQTQAVEILTVVAANIYTNFFNHAFGVENDFPPAPALE